MLRLLCLALTLCFIAPAAHAGPQGRLRVIDADTVDVGGVRVRLFGIDAPEMGQPCTAQGRAWDCGRLARDVMKARFEGQRARCHTQDTDRYGRVVAICQVGETDIAAAIVLAGWAWAYRQYSDRYTQAEAAAAQQGRGLWAVQIAPPAAFRAAAMAAPAAPDAACAIKGNISANGRIYHLPGSRSYDRTRINTAKGERWFCSSAEAEAAGWRAAGG